MATALAKGHICELSASHSTLTRCPHCMSKIEQYNTEINILNIPTFLSKKFNSLKTVSPHSPKPQLTSYIVLSNIFKEFTSEVPQDSLIWDDLLNHGDTQTQNPKEER